MKKLLIFLTFLFSITAYASPGGRWLQSTVSVTTSASMVLPERIGRQYLMIANKGSADIYMKVDSAPGAGEGVLIPAGGNYEAIYPANNPIFLKAASGTVSVELIEG